MVSESVQTNGLVSPPGHKTGPVLTAPPQQWFNSLNRVHHPHHPGLAGYQVQVYNLDTPVQHNQPGQQILQWYKN